MKRKRGRPKLPPECWTDLANLRRLTGLHGREIPLRLNCGGEPAEFVEVKGLANTCRLIMDRYKVVQWIDRRSGRVVAQITDPNTLRVRTTEALKRAKKEEETRLRPQRAVTLKFTTTGRIANAITEPKSILSSELKVSTFSRETMLQIGKRILYKK